jgi:23S rRNA (uracil1939-C5)-methyltransferase
MSPGDRLTLRIEKPVAGGRMIARHEGAVVLVSGAIPGELVEVEIEKVQRGTAWARTMGVLERSSDRVTPEGDWSCGGNVLAHIRYERQVRLKREIVRDAFKRIGRIDVPPEFPVEPSPIEGYRMRARLHVSSGRIGFFREGTHEWCNPAVTRQLLPATLEALAALEGALAAVADGRVQEVELAENSPADERAAHLVLGPGADPSPLGAISRVEGFGGLSCSSGVRSRPVPLWGDTVVSDRVTVRSADGDVAVTLRRQAHAFFQGNRYLLSTLLTSVLDVVPCGRVLDLYAGVGLFSVPLAARGGTTVTAIEGERTSAHDLKDNAASWGGAVRARHQPVEEFLGSARAGAFDAVIVDPPRTGMTARALRGAIALHAPRLAYVSCDVATLARDARTLQEAGYVLTGIRAFDLFPQTAHVETLALFERT